MNTTTLAGIFPDPKPVYRRNFIKENIKQVKQMQGLLQDSGLLNQREDRFKCTPAKVSSNTTPAGATKFKHLAVRSFSQSRQKQPENKSKYLSNRLGSTVAPKLELKSKKSCTKTPPLNLKFTDRAMQTERTDNVNKLYETGVIKYPSPSLPTNKSPGKEKKKNMDHGEPSPTCDMITGIEQLDISEKDYIRNNIKNLRPKANKFENDKKDPTKPPPSYQKGVVPKYLRDRREDVLEAVNEPECPPGHVLLPEEERKETLRVLRQSYADRIQELNSMPVRSDTLRMRKRKMEIEEELNKIDEGIKVFQRPKVFVKINA